MSNNPNYVPKKKNIIKNVSDLQMDDPIAPTQHQNMASAEKINNDSDGVQMETEDFPNMESNHHETSDGPALLLEKEDP
ncbi:Uncharacterized protein APZ42_005535, partial [Daphnia magna]